VIAAFCFDWNYNNVIDRDNDNNGNDDDDDTTTNVGMERNFESVNNFDLKFELKNLHLSFG